MVEHLLAKERVAGSIPVSRLENKRVVPDGTARFVFRAQSRARRFDVFVSLRSALNGGPPDLQRPVSRFRVSGSISDSKVRCLQCSDGRRIQKRAIPSVWYRPHLLFIQFGFKVSKHCLAYALRRLSTRIRPHTAHAATSVINQKVTLLLSPVLGLLTAPKS